MLLQGFALIIAQPLFHFMELAVNGLIEALQ